MSSVRPVAALTEITAARIGPAHGAYTNPSAAPTVSPLQNPSPVDLGPKRASRESGASSRAASAGTSSATPAPARTTIARSRVASLPRPTRWTTSARPTIVTVNVVASPMTMPTGRRRPPVAPAASRAGRTGTTQGLTAVAAPATKAKRASSSIPLGFRPAPERERYASAADGGHRPLRLHEPGLVDAMLELLAVHRVANDLLEVVVGRAGAQWPAQVGFAQAEQARAQPPVGGQPDAVAVATERLGDRVDEPDPAAAVGE